MKILFITEFQAGWWAFLNEIEKLKKENQCFLTDSLKEAQKIVEYGIDKVVMFPISVSYDDYEITSEKNLKFLAGYCFWKQELEKRDIPTIVVNIYESSYSYISGIMEELKKEDWIQNPKVIFFGSNFEQESTQQLVELIAS